MQLMVCEVESEVTIDSRHNVHNHHDPLAFWVRQGSRNFHAFEVVEHRHMKSQVWKYDTCSELK